jgi:hypothetical protein
MTAQVVAGGCTQSARSVHAGATRPCAVARAHCGRPFVGKGMGLVREPDAGNLPVRFDEEGVETE